MRNGHEADGLRPKNGRDASQQPNKLRPSNPATALNPSLSNCVTHHDRFGEVVSLLCDMVAAGRQPNLNTYRIIINACEVTDQAGLAFQVFALMHANKVHILQGKFAQTIYYMLIKACYNQVRRRASSSLGQRSLRHRSWFWSKRAGQLGGCWAALYTCKELWSDAHTIVIGVRLSDGSVGFACSLPRRRATCGCQAATRRRAPHPRPAPPPPLTAAPAPAATTTPRPRPPHHTTRTRRPTARASPRSARWRRRRCWRLWVGTSCGVARISPTRSMGRPTPSTGPAMR